MTDYLPAVSEFAQSLLALALPILAAYLANALKNFLVAQVSALKAQSDDAGDALIDRVIEIAVRAAEQVYSGSGRGSEKLNYALSIADDFLSSKGVKLDLPALRALVEAEVKSAFGK